MDAAHKSNLARILGNRDARGVRQPTPQPDHSSPKLIHGQQGSAYPNERTSPQQPVPFTVAERQPSAQYGSVYQSPTQQRLPPRAPQYQQSASPVQQEASGVSYENNAEYETRNIGGFGNGGSTVYNSYQNGSAVRARDSSPGSYRNASPRAAENVDPKATGSLLSQQANLTKQQVAQQKQLDTMQNELRSGLATVNQTLQTMNSQQQQQQQTLSGARMREFQADSGNLTSRIDSLQQQQLARNGRPYSSQWNGSRGIQSGSSSSMQRGQNTLMQNIPVPVEIDHMTGSRVVGAKKTPKPLNRGFNQMVTERQAQDYDNAVSNMPREPAPLPHNATPYSTSCIDIDSSVTVLRSGDWFLKWNDKGNQVRPRYIWLDTQKNIISWGKDRHTASLLAGYVRIEEILNVTTTQMSETGADDIPRVYYILLIHTPRRTIQLATEKREKLDQWFDALNNIAMFYRVRGSTMHSHEPSTE